MSHMHIHIHSSATSPGSKRDPKGSISDYIHRTHTDTYMREPEKMGQRLVGIGQLSGPDKMFAAYEIYHRDLEPISLICDLS